MKLRKSDIKHVTVNDTYIFCFSKSRILSGWYESRRYRANHIPKCVEEFIRENEAVSSFIFNGEVLSVTYAKEKEA